MNRHVLDVISECDVIIEVVDSRDIKGTRSRELEKLVKRKRKKLIVVINKTDLQKPRNLPIAKVVMMSAKLKKGTRALRSAIHSCYPEKEKIKAGVVGYANTGKSSVINAMGGRAKISSTPGSTKGKQWLRVSRRVVLLDSPGIIPGDEDETNLVLKGSLDVTKIKDPIGAALKLIDKMELKTLQEAYGIEGYEDSYEQLEELAGKWLMLRKGAELDLDRAARRLLRDRQRGKI